MKILIFNPLFQLGLAIRLVLILTAMPHAVSDWYIPFLDASTTQFSFDPWSVWLSSGGESIAFPYGYAMWIAFLPLTIAAKITGLPLLYGYAFTLLAADIALLLVLRRMLPNRDRLLLIAYWLSPIVLLATYGMGFNDLLPVLLLSVSLYFTRRVQLKIAGVACVAAISAKLSMVLALPFFLIYFFNNRALRQLLLQFINGLLIGSAIFILPFMLSSSGLHMLFSNPEIGKVYQLALNLGTSNQIYVVPLIYMVMIYMVWRVRRLNFDLFHATLGTSFILVVLMTPISPGWFVWAIPLLVSYQAMSGRIAIALASIFSSLYVLISLINTPIRLSGIGQLDIVNALQFPAPFGSHATSLLNTAMVATGIILAMRIWRESISRNDFFRLSRKPFVIGIAGDAGSGKGTLSDSITGLFGNHSVTTLSGANYHLWDRHKPMWQVMTHLNPMANDLERFANDLVTLTDGKNIQSGQYDHQTGRISRPSLVKSNDIIIASGLHALYLPILRECYNLSIYLDMDDDLRRLFKIQEDVKQRGHNIAEVVKAFEKRKSDSIRFIKPQEAYADLTLSLQPIHSHFLEDLSSSQPLRYKLVARSRHGINELTLTRVLVGICGLHVDMIVSGDSAKVELTIEGETSAQDIALAAQMICPRIFEFLDINPKWQDGVTGLMQLITLSHINQALTKRFI